MFYIIIINSCPASDFRWLRVKAKYTTSSKYFANSHQDKAWCCKSTNAGILTHFNNYLITFFKVWTSAPVTTQYVRGQVWTRFSSFLSSEEYIQFWTSLYTVVGVQEISLLSFELTCQFHKLLETGNIISNE